MEIINRYFNEFSDTQRQQMAALGDLYREWNEKINVISRKDIDSLYEKHVLHSLAIAAVIDFLPGTSVIDIGTGGGFPGIPLAIYYPGVQFHLIDSIGKKIKVVQAVADALQLKNVKALQLRVEEFRSHHHSFDFAVSRAVAPLGTLCRWAQPLIRKKDRHPLPNGLLCLKGGDLHQEISDSGQRPRIYELDTIFKEPFFKDKYLLHVAL